MVPDFSRLKSDSLTVQIGFEPNPHYIEWSSSWLVLVFGGVLRLGVAPWRLHFFC